jgi:hypothetical protein
MWGDYNIEVKVEMIKKKEGGDQAIDAKQPIQGANTGRRVLAAFPV